MPLKSLLRPVLTSALWVVAFLAVSYLIGEVTRVNMPWYETLERSPLNPPRIAFPIVWTLLYILLAVCGSMLWAQRKSDSGSLHCGLFAAYMAMNWAWSFIFFAGHAVMAGFWWIVVSDILLAVLIAVLLRHGQKTSALLLVPTLLWGTFAAYLNGYIAF